MITLVVPLLAAFFATGSFQKDALLKAFITSEPLTNDWVAPGARDRSASVSDLAGCYHRSDVMRIVKNRDEADFVIEITGRGETEHAKTVTVYAGPGAATKLVSGKYVEATVHIGGRDFHFVGSTKRRSWTDAAINLSKDIERWAKDNQERIRATRSRR